MSLDRFAELARGCGFGRRAGIDLPGEKEGLVPTEEYMDRRYGRSGWGRGYLLNHAIGQGEILASPLQVARFYGALGTGRLVEPHLLIRSVDIDGNRATYGPGGSEALPIPEELLAPIREGLVAVVESERGTGRSARVPGVRVAGKTGTAENPHGEDHAWFAAWAPAEEPRIAIADYVANAGHGGEVAAPIAGSLLRYLFAREGA
jgi:penicillin-binding protein 2